MRAFEFLLEAVPAMKARNSAGAAPMEPTDGVPAENPEVEQLKLALSAKIKELPTDEATQRLLHEIEDLLASIGAGSRSKFMGKTLELINDPDVNKAQKLLAKYIVSMDSEPSQRKALLDAWKNDQLVNVKLLLTPGKHTVSNLIIGYDKNPAIKELADDLSQIAFLGQGKGEFMLSVFSKKITKAEKGDLHIDGVGTIEVKTTDVGAGRFYDQQVRPTTEYQGVVNAFRKTFAQEIEAQKVMTTTGINLPGLTTLYQSLDVSKRDLFKKSLNDVMVNIFPAVPDLAAAITDSILAGNLNQAKQRYAVANLNNYTASKTEDKGILMIDLSKEPYTFVFFTDNKSLNAGGMRLHSSTGYPITNDPRNAYPQTKIVSTSQAQE